MFSAIISKWPSKVELARDLGVSAERVSKWSKRESVPPENWRSMIVAAKVRGFNLSIEDMVSAAEASARARRTIRRPAYSRKNSSGVTPMTLSKASNC